MERVGKRVEPPRLEPRREAPRQRVQGLERFARVREELHEVDEHHALGLEERAAVVARRHAAVEDAVLVRDVCREVERWERGEAEVRDREVGVDRGGERRPRDVDLPRDSTVRVGQRLAHRAAHDVELEPLELDRRVVDAALEGVERVRDAGVEQARPLDLGAAAVAEVHLRVVREVPVLGVLCDVERVDVVDPLDAATAQRSLDEQVRSGDVARDDDVAVGTTRDVGDRGADDRAKSRDVEVLEQELHVLGAVEAPAAPRLEAL